MTTTAQTISPKKLTAISPARKISMGLVEIIIGLLIYFIFAATLSADVQTVFVMTPGGIDVGQMADWVLPARLSLTILQEFALHLAFSNWSKVLAKPPTQWWACVDYCSSLAS